LKENNLKKQTFLFKKSKKIQKLMLFGVVKAKNGIFMQKKS